MNNSVNTSLFFLFLAILYVISPFVAFVIALLFFKRGVSQFFMIAFAFYFGYQVGPILDLLNHYNNYLTFGNRSLPDLFTDPLVLISGQEPYHILFKFALASIDASDRLFSAFAAAVYAVAFLVFFRQLKPFYIDRMTKMQMAAMILMVVSIDFYWYVGLRFWTGAFLMLAVYMRYVVKGQKTMLLLLPIGILFHYVLILPVVLLYLTLLLKNRNMLLLILVGVSYVFKYIEYGFLNYAGKIPFVNAAFRDKLQAEATVRALKEQANFFRSDGNFIYQHRTDLIFFSVVLILLNLFFRNRNLLRYFPQLFAAVCITLIATNLGYSEYVFYTRMYKLVALLISLYLFLLLSTPEIRKLRFNVVTNMFLLGVALFSLLISLVQIRSSVFNVELWLGNYFVEVPIYEYATKVKF